jgi:hypothetical protein
MCSPWNHKKKKLSEAFPDALDSKMVIRYNEFKRFTPYITGPRKKGNSETLKLQFYCVGIKNYTSRINHSVWRRDECPVVTYRFFFNLCVGTLGTAATYWPIVSAPDDRRWWLWRNWWNEDWQGKPKYSEKTCPSATLSTTNPTWLDPVLNPGRRGGKPATNRLSYVLTDT